MVAPKGAGVSLVDFGTCGVLCRKIGDYLFFMCSILSLACCLLSISAVVFVAVTSHKLAVVVTLKTTLDGSFI